MIDIHSHILYGVDDGAKTVQDSLDMAKEAVDQGIQVIYATPHHLNGQFENSAAEVKMAVQLLNELLSNHKIGLEVRVGQEVRINGDLLEHLDSGEILTLGDKGTYILVELPSNDVPAYTGNLLFDLQVEGLKPIIVHPERNSEIVQKPDILFDLVNNGALTQVTAASVAGKFGKTLQKFSLDLIDANLTHFVASDAHNISTRAFWMDDAFSIIEAKLGIDTVYYLKENAQILGSNEMVIGDPPQQIKTKRKFKLFKK